MRTIYRYPLDPTTDGDSCLLVPMPEGAEILAVGPKGDGPVCAWAAVDPGRKMEARRIYVFGTGHPLKEGLRHISTFQLDGGALVFHAFEPVQTRAPRGAP